MAVYRRHDYFRRSTVNKKRAVRRQPTRLKTKTTQGDYNMTDKEYKDREERLYKAIQAISEKALCVASGGRTLVDGAYKNETEAFRYRKHLNNAEYGFEDLFNLVGELGKILEELEEEYEEEETQ